MWNTLLDLGKRIVSLLRKSEQHSEDIGNLQEHEAVQDERIGELSEAIRQLTYSLRHDRDVADRDRENLLLRLENTLLRFERRLPPGDNADGETGILGE